MNVKDSVLAMLDQFVATSNTANSFAISEMFYDKRTEYIDSHLQPLDKFSRRETSVVV